MRSRERTSPRARTRFARCTTKNPVDGWISLEVLPSLAADTEKTVAEAKRLSSALARPNVFIKVPATPAGIPAIRRLIGEGISINITLMFNRKHYREVANAYLGGLSDFAAKGGDLSRVHSVASFFVSRVDTLVDKLLGEKIQKASGKEKTRLESLLGKAGLANSKVVYEDFLAIFNAAPFAALRAKGRARPAAALGVHGHEEPRLLRSPLRREPHRPRHREHDAREDARGAPRSRQDAGRHRAGRRRRGEKDARRPSCRRDRRRGGRRAAARRTASSSSRSPTTSSSRRSSRAAPRP